jgi:hypothetical protein
MATCKEVIHSYEVATDSALLSPLISDSIYSLIYKDDSFKTKLDITSTSGINKKTLYIAANYRLNLISLPVQIDIYVCGYETIVNSGVGQT